MVLTWAAMDGSPSGVDFFTKNPSDFCGIIKLSAEVLTFTKGFGRSRIPLGNERRRGGRAVECTGLENLSHSVQCSINSISYPWFTTCVTPNGTLELRFKRYFYATICDRL